MTDHWEENVDRRLEKLHDQVVAGQADNVSDEQQQPSELTGARQLFELIEFQDSDHGETILGIETRLAESQWPRVQLRNANARYNLFLHNAERYYSRGRAHQ